MELDTGTVVNTVGLVLESFPNFDLRLLLDLRYINIRIRVYEIRDEYLQMK